ncbi:hydrogenase maturation nickel metallochaperone HypA/HybF [Salisediminibacterium beveridgei]|uniref:[NiFe] hydrogenase nickel incorporation protein HypA n=1 Tax=Salisediminibacterium beveridgei TaxID=632773 RepID=A0A1D7QXE3_9BACI|nr:hydrogenase maturation nickel metallochaperone HypA [Salisediminibacterium beveridgei]AOM83674.1 [NiFe] hydrogenase nickel incorporation protein HypA [Salisediminibacterium beveridgei]
MHEVALMEDILAIVDRHKNGQGFDYVNEIELIVGDISNVMPEALFMAFDMLKASGEYPFLLEDAMLVMEQEAAEARCTVCKRNYKPDNRFAFCPDCEMPSGEIIKGEVFQIISYEGGRYDESEAQ